MNYQNWHGFTDGRFGYGSMLNGFLSAVPKGVVMDEQASVDVNMTVPFAIKGWLKGAHRVIFTMWETDELPDKFARWVGQYDQVLVPCEHNVEVFSPYHRSVTYVPLGVDTGFWFPQDVPRQDKFIFTCGGSLWMRKGLDLVVEAFRRLNLPDAELWIKAAPHANDVPKNLDLPNVRWFREWMSLEEERRFYASGDCFVAPARGEGFGLIPLQNIALGVPTLVTAGSGQAQFAHLAAGDIGWSLKPTGVGRWHEASIEDLMAQMRWQHADRDNQRVLARLRASKVEEEFSWRLAAEKLAAAVPVGKRLVSHETLEPSVSYAVRVTQQTTVEINSRKWHLSPGQEYEVPEGVHEVLSGAKVLERMPR